MPQVFDRIILVDEELESLLLRHCEGGYIVFWPKDGDDFGVIGDGSTEEHLRAFHEANGPSSGRHHLNAALQRITEVRTAALEKLTPEERAILGLPQEPPAGGPADADRVPQREPLPMQAASARQA